MCNGHHFVRDIFQRRWQLDATWVRFLFFLVFFSFFVSLSDFFFAASTRGRRRRRTSPFIRLINQPRPIINSHSSPSNKSPPTMSHDVPRIFSTIVLCAPVRLSADDLGPIRWYTNCPWLDMFCFFFWVA